MTDEEFEKEASGMIFEESYKEDDKKQNNLIRDAASAIVDGRTQYFEDDNASLFDKIVLEDFDPK